LELIPPLEIYKVKNTLKFMHIKLQLNIIGHKIALLFYQFCLLLKTIFKGFTLAKYHNYLIVQFKLLVIMQFCLFDRKSN